MTGGSAASGPGRTRGRFDHDHARPVPACALYLLGALDAGAEAAFERHLARCAVCQDECDRLGPIVSGMGELDADEVSGPGGGATEPPRGR